MFGALVFPDVGILGLGGFEGTLGVQINHVVGVYVAPELDLAFGDIRGVAVSAAARIDFTIAHVFVGLGPERGRAQGSASHRDEHRLRSALAVDGWTARSGGPSHDARDGPGDLAQPQDRHAGVLIARVGPRRLAPVPGIAGRVVAGHAAAVLRGISVGVTAILGLGGCGPVVPSVTAARYADCNPALAADLIDRGALVIEVRGDGASASVLGALAVAPQSVVMAVEREARARCGVVVLSVDGWSGAATAALRDAGYEATDLGEVGAWRYVSPAARDAVASAERAGCSP